MTDLFGRLMIDIDGLNLSNEDKFLLSNKHIGGLILFSKNFDTYDQLYNLIKEVRLIKENIIIAVDQEGGRVQRFEKEFTKIPSMREVSIFKRENDDQEFIKDLAWLKNKRQVAVLVNRFRWENKSEYIEKNSAPERVKSLLIIDNVLNISSQGIDRSDSTAPLNLLNFDLKKTKKNIIFFYLYQMYQIFPSNHLGS